MQWRALIRLCYPLNALAQDCNGYTATREMRLLRDNDLDVLCLAATVDRTIRNLLVEGELLLAYPRSDVAIFGFALWRALDRVPDMQPYILVFFRGVPLAICGYIRAVLPIAQRDMLFGMPELQAVLHEDASVHGLYLYCAAPIPSIEGGRLSSVLQLGLSLTQNSIKESPASTKKIRGLPLL
jgi:hypothetical protein